VSQASRSGLDPLRYLLLGSQSTTAKRAVFSGEPVQQPRGRCAFLLCAVRRTARVDGSRLRRATSARRDGADEQARGVRGAPSPRIAERVTLASQGDRRVFGIAAQSYRYPCRWCYHGLAGGRCGPSFCRRRGSQRLLFVACGSAPLVRSPTSFPSRELVIGAERRYSTRSGGSEMIRLCFVGCTVDLW
jgi:hypothetical protein